MSVDLGTRVATFAADARSAETLQVLDARFKQQVRSYGFTTYAAGPLTGAAVTFLLLDWPPAWLQIYAARGFAQVDLAVAEALSSPVPFTWTEIKARKPGASAEIFAEAERFGWVEGLVVPVHRQDGERGVVSLAGPKMTIDAEIKSEAVAISLAAYERARELVDAVRIGGEPLTNRERQVLLLVADGKSDAEIGLVLGISKDTAHFHLEKARRKLGAATRAHAVALALLHRLV